MPAADKLREWEFIGQFFVTKRDKTRRFRTGDCCRIKGGETLWRIIGIERNRYTDEIRVKLRNEHVVSLVLFEDGNHLRFVKPPYPI
jgi:hypothetical protein